MDARAEGQMGVFLAANIVNVRVLEDPFVVVAGADELAQAVDELGATLVGDVGGAEA